MKATVISFALLIGFFYAGDMMRRLFHVDIESFSVAGAFVIFLMSLEMILDIEIFKNQGPDVYKRQRNVRVSVTYPIFFIYLTVSVDIFISYVSGNDAVDVYKRQVFDLMIPSYFYLYTLIFYFH